MAFTTHENIRKYAGLQNVFVRNPVVNSPGISTITFFVETNDNYRFVPHFNTGNTSAGVSDVQAWMGLSGVLGGTRLTVSSLDIEQGSITLSTVPSVGSSVVVSYASSSVSGDDIERTRKEADSIINQRLSLCYDLPISPVPSSLESMSTRLSAAFLMIRGYGTGYKNTAEDGYALYDQLMGTQEELGSDAIYKTKVGEIGKICTPGFRLVDDNGSVILRSDDGGAANTTFLVGGKGPGRIHVIDNEEFRRQPFDTNSQEPGSGRGRRV